MIKQILAPGIILYKTDKDQVENIKNAIEKTIEGKWRQAGVVNTDTYEGELNTTSRKCYDYAIDQGMTAEEIDLLNLTDAWINPTIEDFRAEYQAENIVRGPYIYLKYENSDKFDWHIDDGGKFPRTVSVSAYLNDDYEGGEIEFKHYNISHKPSAGDIIVFGSSFTYMHRVKPVVSGTRYAVVNWYRYSTYPWVIQ